MKKCEFRFMAWEVFLLRVFPPISKPKSEVFASYSMVNRAFDSCGIEADRP